MRISYWSSDVCSSDLKFNWIAVSLCAQSHRPRPNHGSCEGIVKAKYLELIGLIERLHRQCLEVIKSDLDRQGIRDLNNVQALILFNIGEEELSIGEPTQRGYYLGSNVSYNVKQLVENGYLIQERSPHDRRDRKSTRLNSSH